MARVRIVCMKVILNQSANRMSSQQRGCAIRVSMRVDADGAVCMQAKRENQILADFKQLLQEKTAEAGLGPGSSM